MSWETSSMTSLGRKGNTKIAGQLISQLWALNPRPDQGSQYVFNVSDSPTNCSLSLSLFFSLFLSLFPHFLSLSSSSSICNPLSWHFFSFSQTLWSSRQGHTLYSWQSAVCGAVAGAGDYMLCWERGRRGGKGVGMDGWTDRWMLDRIGE